MNGAAGRVQRERGGRAPGGAWTGSARVRARRRRHADRAICGVNVVLDSATPAGHDSIWDWRCRWRSWRW